MKNEIYNTLEHYLSYAKCGDVFMNSREKEGLIALTYSTFNSMYNLFEIEKMTGKIFATKCHHDDNVGEKRSLQEPFKAI